MISNAIICLVYGLLIAKHIQMIVSFISQKVLEQDNFQPETIMTNFKSGTTKSFKEMLSKVVYKSSSYFFRKIHA